jgi:hypothetical protein
MTVIRPAPDPDFFPVLQHLIFVCVPEQIKVGEGVLGYGYVDGPHTVVEKWLMMEREGMDIHLRCITCKRGNDQH